MPTPPTLLLADDSLTIQRVVSLTFADQPVRVVVARDGQDAINRMTTDRPDLVLADTNMPCVDGYELARWIRQQPHLTGVPVLLLAGVTDPVDEQRLHDSGANGVLEKPFEPSHVISRVKELLGLKGTPASGTRLVTAPDSKPPSQPGSKPASPSPVGRAEPAAAPPARPVAVPGPPAPMMDPATQDPPFGRGPDPDAAEAAASSPGADPGGEDWFPFAAHPPSARTALLAEELGVAEVRFYEQSDQMPSARALEPEPGPLPGRARPLASASAADVFESLLAAEQGDAPAPVVGPVLEIPPEMLDQLAARVVERLRPSVLRDELQRGLGLGLREAVNEALRDSVAAETRAAVAEAVQAAVNGTILGTIRGAVHEAVAGAMPAALDHAVAQMREALAHEVRQSVAPLIQDAVRQVLGDTVREAVAAAVPGAVLEAVRGDGAGQVRDIVRETAERLVTEEIARIRARRPA